MGPLSNLLSRGQGLQLAHTIVLLLPNKALLLPNKETTLHTLLTCGVVRVDGDSRTGVAMVTTLAAVEAHDGRGRGLGVDVRGRGLPRVANHPRCLGKDVHPVNSAPSSPPTTTTGRGHGPQYTVHADYTGGRLTGVGVARVVVGGALLMRTLTPDDGHGRGEEVGADIFIPVGRHGPGHLAVSC